MNFKILDRYIFKQILTATVFGLLLFIIVWISPEILFKIIRKFINGEIGLLMAFKLFLLEIPEIVSKAIPVGLLIGSLFVFDRLSRDSELTIIRVSGVNVYRLMIPVIFLSIIGAFICFFIYKDIIPYSTSEIKRLKSDIYQQNFVYIDKKPDKKPKQLLIVGAFDGKNLYDIKLLKFGDEITENKPLMESIITAKTAEITADNWILTEVIKYEIAANGVYKKTKRYDKYEILDAKTSQEAKQLLVYSTKRAREMNNKDFKEYLGLMKNLDLTEEYRFSLSKFYQRYSHSFGCILMAICGVLLGISKPREKRFIGFTVAAALIFAYYILIPFLDMLAQTGSISPFLSAWFPDLMVLALIFILVKLKNI